MTTSSRRNSTLLIATLAATFAFLSVPRALRAADTAPKPAAGSRIISGTNVPTSQFPTVGEVGDTSDATFYYCTGTLISPKHVLTAGHCLTGNNGALTVAQNAALFRLGGAVYHSSHIYVHPAWKGGNNGDAEGEFDAIVVELDTAVANVSPTPLYRQAPTVGQLLTIAGYGELGTGSAGRNGKTPAAGTINYGTTPIDIVTGTYIKWNFENTTPQESNTAPGDSGGPAFITVNGVLQVAGITNGGALDSAGYGDQSYDTRVDAIAAWIDQVTSGATQGSGGTPGTGGNSGIIIASPASASSTTPAANQAVTFTVSATSASGGAVSYAWDFGDGSKGSGASVQHTYTANGNYTATVTISDGNVGTATSSVNVNVGGTGAILIQAVKGSFRLNFKTDGRDMLDITFQASDFTFLNRQTFASRVDGEDVTVSIAGTTLDELSLTKNGSGVGDGRIHWNPRTGLIRYQLRNADLMNLLSNYGAVNDDTEDSVQVPFTLTVGNQTYSATYTFDYRARADINGQGR